MEYANSKTQGSTREIMMNTSIWLRGILMPRPRSITREKPLRMSGLSYATRLELLRRGKKEQETIKLSLTLLMSKTSQDLFNHLKQMLNGDSSGRLEIDLLRSKMTRHKFIQKTSQNGKSK
jgi:hypothetical protein